ncbi:MAG: ParB/RepB/Spo0J family partition protein [Clostridia bacterium]|nr:ParB/RepB/Spo0J family partition protein [Clostridia bacterium]
MSTKGLGRGLNAFFDNAQEVKEVATAKKDTILEKVVELKMADVEPMLNQPRKKFDKSKLDELSESIKEHGVIQPILVVKDSSGYKIVAGERRWRASKLAGKTTIPAIVKDYTDGKKKQVALIENIQREDLNIMEIAHALKELMDMEEYNVADVAKVTAKSPSTVSNILRLLKLSNPVQELVLDGKLVEGQARALLTIENQEEQLKLANKIIEKKLTVREVEKLIYDDNKYIVKKKKTVNKNSINVKIEEKLSEFFGMKVKIDQSKSSPRLVIEYYNNDGLANLLEKLNIEL